MSKTTTSKTAKKPTVAELEKTVKALASRVDQVESHLAKMEESSVPNLDAGCPTTGWCGQFFQFLRVNPVSGVSLVLVTGILIGVIFG